MLSESEYRQFVLRIEEASLAKGRKLSSRESLDTLLLGVLSTSLGVAICADFGIALLGGEKRYLAIGSFMVSMVAGVWLGTAGILLARRKGRLVSPLSALGTILCALPMALPILLCLVVL